MFHNHLVDEEARHEVERRLRRRKSIVYTSDLATATPGLHAGSWRSYCCWSRWRRWDCSKALLPTRGLIQVQPQSAANH